MLLTFENKNKCEDIHKKIKFLNKKAYRAMPYFSWLVAGFSFDRSNFVPGWSMWNLSWINFSVSIWFSNHYASVPLAYSLTYYKCYVTMLRSLLNRSQNTHKQMSRTSSVFILPAHSGDDLHIPN